MLVNHERICALRSEVGDDGFGEVVSLFLEESDEVFARLIGRSAADVSADVHFLRGSALTLGLDDLAEWCARHEQRPLQPQDFAELADLYRRSRDTFQAEISSSVAA